MELCDNIESVKMRDGSCTKMQSKGSITPVEDDAENRGLRSLDSGQQQCNSSNMLVPSHVTRKIYKLCRMLIPAAQRECCKLGWSRHITTMVPIALKIQIVVNKGMHTDYFVKARIEGSDSQEYVHLRVFRNLGCPLDQAVLSAVQVDKHLTDALEYF
jgi:hypothetical protein